MIRLVKRAGLFLASVMLCATNAYAASGNSVDLLSYIPADTPYVFVSTEPLPSKVADKLEPTIDEILQVYQRILRHLMAEQLVKMAGEENSAEEAEQFRGVMEEVLGLVSLEGIRGAGIERASAFALYGNSLLPVLRFELSDDDLFDAAIERIEKKAGEDLLIGVANGESYKYTDTEQVRLIIATVDDQAIITAVPVQFSEPQIAEALGLKKPRASLKSSKALKSMAKEYGFSDYMTGFINNQRIAEIFTGKATEKDKQLLAAFSEQPPELSETCSAEIMEMVGIAPRMVFGYSDINTRGLKSSFIVELRKDIAKSLATIPAPVPGLGTDPGGLMSIGFGLNPLALRSFYEAQLDAMEADPYECESFADLQAGVAKGREALNQPVPPVVYSFRGMVANITDIQSMDFASNITPESIDASILIAVENAEALIMMAAMMDPQIAALNLLPDGKARKLELAQLAEFAGMAYAALSTNALSVSLGASAEKKSADMLLASAPDPAPFMSMSMDSARYYAMVGETMAKQPTAEGEEEIPPAIRAAMAELMTLSGSLYDRMFLDVRFTERGVEIGANMTLSD
ncbi:MAG: hypothetical protein OEV58_09380 [Gammaproteobacteria bacterium]|nr:hypothetical protein [Gammaproteobacteria bacterium]MDH5261147.1 hypothetical protein [Gammaproteobacteria bacterium]